MAEIVYRPPYGPSVMRAVTRASAASSAAGTETPTAAGRLRLVSQLTCQDAGDAEFGALTHSAGCRVNLPVTLRRLRQVTVSYRPASFTYQGIITDETGVSSVDLQWRVYPDTWVSIGGTWTQLTPPLPPQWRPQFRDQNSDDHSWGPLVVAFTPSTSAQWTPGLPVPPNACPVLDVGVAAQHWFSANDVSLVSGLDVDFTVAFIVVDYA
jgi:hypothetical protein